MTALLAPESGKNVAGRMTICRRRWYWCSCCCHVRNRFGTRRFGSSGLSTALLLSTHFWWGGPFPSCSPTAPTPSDTCPPAAPHRPPLGPRQLVTLICSTWTRVPRLSLAFFQLGARWAELPGQHGSAMVQTRTEDRRPHLSPCATRTPYPGAAKRGRRVAFPRRGSRESPIPQKPTASTPPGRALVGSGPTGPSSHLLQGRRGPEDEAGPATQQPPGRNHGRRALERCQAAEAALPPGGGPPTALWAKLPRRGPRGAATSSGLAKPSRRLADAAPGPQSKAFEFLDLQTPQRPPFVRALPPLGMRACGRASGRGGAAQRGNGNDGGQRGSSAGHGRGSRRADRGRLKGRLHGGGRRNGQRAFAHAQGNSNPTKPRKAAGHPQPATPQANLEGTGPERPRRQG